MKIVAILDLETSGLDPATDKIVEVGVVLWSVEHRTILECYSSLLPAMSNDASRFNGIAPEVLRGTQDPGIIWQIVDMLVERADAVVAHQADFDQKFLVELHAAGQDDNVAANAMSVISKPWICTVEDFVWPEPLPYRNLTSLALAHGVAVVSAHRAIHDCLLLARVLEAASGMVGHDLFALALERATREKATFVSRAPYEKKDLVKAAGFHWDGESWTRRMAVEDAEKLPFDVARVPT